MQRIGRVIKLKQGKEEEYIKLHQNVWPQILSLLSECRITNFSIYLKDGYLFSYYEYVGTDYDADMKKMDESAINQKWLKEFTDPCQEPLSTRKPGEWWAQAEEVFHMD